eukprot:CAMPEP_0172709626 /NCGR_PEP_ID=MMETSP1074-20121228/55179_1 /TAXON_ID=2916 /ORGANISM="Ceratium fusus, Strain PA161109" /LENGTH=136 /DNA_ID=CAMNT_0013532911 /DNA_START=60 /DNA_END=470 /DNA_ORIENTATION=-
MVSTTAEENNGVTANQPAQRVGKRASSPAPKPTSQAAVEGVSTTLNEGAPKADTKDKKPSEKPPAVGMAGSAFLVVCVLIVCIHLFYTSFLAKMGMPFAGALKDNRIPVGIAVVGMLIGAAAFTKKFQANGKEKAS